MHGSSSSHDTGHDQRTGAGDDDAYRVGRARIGTAE